MNSVILKPYRISDIDFDKIIYSPIKMGKNKKVVYLKYDHEKKNNLTFQTPSLFNSDELKKKNGFYELDIPLFGKSTNKVDELYTFLKDLDKKIIQDGRKNHKTWFNGLKNITYKSIIRSSLIKDNIYKNGVLRIKISDKPNDNTILVNNEGKNISLDDIKPNTHIKMILECYAVWITDNGFGLYLKPILLSLNEIKTVSYKYELLDDSDEEIDIIEDVMDTEINPTTHNTFIQEVMDDLNKSDEETSHIELPDNLKIIKEKNTSDLKSNLISELENKNNIPTNIKETTEEITTYDNTDDNIQTYKNYTSENKNSNYNKNPNYNKNNIKLNIEKYNYESSSEEEEEGLVKQLEEKEDLVEQLEEKEDLEEEKEELKKTKYMEESSTESEENKILSNIAIVSKNMMSQIKNNETDNKISLINSELNSSTSSDNFDINSLQNSLQHIIKNNI